MAYISLTAAAISAGVASGAAALTSASRLLSVLEGDAFPVVGTAYTEGVAAVIVFAGVDADPSAMVSWAISSCFYASVIWEARFSAILAYSSGVG